MADHGTAEPTMCLTLYRTRPLLAWPAPDTVKVLETMSFVGGARSLNSYLLEGWTVTPTRTMTVRKIAT